MHRSSRDFVRRMVAGWIGILGIAAQVGCLGQERAEEPDADLATTEALAEVECLPTHVTWPNPSSTTDACVGPWIYWAYPTEYGPDSSCGPPHYPSCTRWVAQAPKKPTNDLTFPAINCHLVPNVGLVCDPDTASAQAACVAFKNQKRDEVEGPADQRVTSASSSVENLTPGQTATQHTFRCHVTIEYEKSFMGEHPDCGAGEYPSCTHVVPGSPLHRNVTSAGLTKNAVLLLHDDSPEHQVPDGDLVARCSSGQDVPSTQMKAKLSRILDTLNDVSIPKSSALIDDLVRRAKITYELFTDADVSTFTNGQHTQVLSLYENRKAVLPACGRNKEMTTDLCNGDWALQLCTRLTSKHVKVEAGKGNLVRYLYPQCLYQLDAMGEEVETHACEADGVAAAQTLEAQRGVQEKLFLNLGRKVNPAPSANNAPLIADTLHQVSQWYAAAGRLLVGEGQLANELDLVTNKFWQALYGYRMTTEGTEWTPNSPYAALEAALEEAEDASSPANAQAILNNALSDTDTRGLKLDREVLMAIYSDVAAEHAMEGAPLLHFTADALAPLVARLESLVEFHDVGCALADCVTFTTPTKLSRFWNVLAHLDTPPGEQPDLEDVLDPAGPMVGWKVAFQAVAAAQDRLLNALADDADEDRPLRELLARARARTISYEKTGLFMPPQGNRLLTAAHAQRRELLQQDVAAMQADLQSATDRINSQLIALVSGLVDVRGGDTALAQLQADETRLLVERDDLATRDAALRALINGTEAGAESILEEIMEEWARVEGSIDQEDYIRVGSSTELYLSAQDATFDGWSGTSVEDIASRKISVVGGQTVSIAVDGSWAPSCALRDVRALDPDDGQPGQTIDPTGVTTGPEGFSITWTGSRFEASSSARTDTKRITIGDKAEACIPIAGGLFSACPYVDVSRSWGWEDTRQDGSEQRTAAQFASGIFIPSTPFEAPAGALVIVELPPGQTSRTAIRNVHLVHSPHTTITVNEDSDLWFAVNDIACAEQDGDYELHIRVGTFSSVGDFAGALLPRMAHTVALVRERLPGLLARGELLPDERTEIEHEAKIGQVGGPGEPQVAVDDYPEPMRDIFYKHLAREMVRLDASIRLATHQREIVIREAQYLANQRSLRNAQMNGYLLSLVPRWTARGLRFKELRDDTALFARNIRYYVAPFLKLWYPGAVQAIKQGSTSLQSLAGLDVDTPVTDLSQWMADVGADVIESIEQAGLPYPTPGETAPVFVALRFANPARLDPSCADVPSARCWAIGQSPDFQWATVAQARALWATLGEPADGALSRHVVFQPNPDDLYEPSGGTSYLPCTKSLPVARKFGLALTGFQGSDLPTEPRDRTFTIPAAAPMGFIDSTGTHMFQLDNPVWHNLASVPFIYGNTDYNQIRAAFTSLVQDERGVSPFTTFSLDISEDVVDRWSLREAATIDLLFELEATRSASVVATSACGVAP